MRIVKHLFGVVLLVGATVTCGDVARQSQAPVYLVLNSLVGNPGSGGSSGGGNVLHSDVITNVTSPAPCSPSTPCPTVFSDSGIASFSLALKDITAPTGPTSNNAVRLNRYHVSYRRADGRSTQGTDVPYAFDGAVTVTVGTQGNTPVGFELVRHVAKEESPLVQLISSPTIITMIADVTFYGADQVGNDISVSGSIQIDFGNFGDQ